MLTFVEAISLAGDRAKQNDDLMGVRNGRAWVIDGATDLHSEPVTGWASDASWIAQAAGEAITQGDDGEDEASLRALVRAASASAKAQFESLSPRPVERWKSPIASLLIVNETSDGVIGLDLGDCRAFALEADGTVHVAGGVEESANAEAKLAAQQTDAHKPLMERADTLEKLRNGRAALNRRDASWTFCLDPACAEFARVWRMPLRRPAHLLLMTDGFSSLADRYHAYDAAGLVRAAVDAGLQELGRQLRAIEVEDAGAARHPRFKASDDATALLMRLS